MSSFRDLAVDVGCLSEHFGCLPYGLLFSIEWPGFLLSIVDSGFQQGKRRSCKASESFVLELE